MQPLGVSRWPAQPATSLDFTLCQTAVPVTVTPPLTVVPDAGDVMQICAVAPSDALASVQTEAAAVPARPSQHATARPVTIIPTHTRMLHPPFTAATTLKQ